MVGTRFLTVGRGAYRQTRRGGWDDPYGNGLQLETTYKLMFSLR